MLTNAAAKAAGAQARAYKLFDSGGLFLFVAPTGTKSWRLKYRVAGREKLLTIGRFPDLSVNQARMRMLEAKDLLGRGVDPSAKASREEQGGNFEQLVRAWHRHNESTWSPAHASDAIGSLERDILPTIGPREPDEIDAPELLELLRRVERRGNITTAHRIRQRLSEIYAFGIAEGICHKDPAAKLGAAMREVPPSTPHPALTTIDECRALISACEALDARRSTLLASRFLALTAVRLDAVRGARWDEIEGLDTSAPVWRVPPARMKLARSKKDEERFAHIVPLSVAAVAVLREAQQFAPNAMKSDLIFPGRDPARSIGEGALRELYNRAGFAGRHVPHGWRSSFSTILNEKLGEEWRLAIDMALAHAAKGRVEAAYNRSQLLDRRRALFSHWGAMLSGQKPTGV